MNLLNIKAGDDVMIQDPYTYKWSVAKVEEVTAKGKIRVKGMLFGFTGRYFRGGFYSGYKQPRIDIMDQETLNSQKREEERVILADQVKALADFLSKNVNGLNIEQLTSLKANLEKGTDSLK